MATNEPDVCEVSMFKEILAKPLKLDMGAIKLQSNTFCKLLIIKRAFNFLQTVGTYMGVYFRGFTMLVPQQLLNKPQIGSGFQ
jgi:hypothetical protein